MQAHSTYSWLVIEYLYNLTLSCGLPVCLEPHSTRHASRRHNYVHMPYVCTLGTGRLEGKATPDLEMFALSLKCRLLRQCDATIYRDS